MNNNQKTILILGSGMMVEPLIDHMLLRPENNLIIASNIIKDAKSICEIKGIKRCRPEEVDVVNSKDFLRKLVKQADLVISYIPAFLHIHVFNICLEMGKNLLTSSYISPEMQKNHQKVKNANLTFINEIGLDPGLDHLIAHKIINECKLKNETIVGYESWCGALPSPDSVDNPLMYKFSWSPKGVLAAMKNNATYLLDDKVINVPNSSLLKSTVNKEFHRCLNFEGYYNRDSLK